MKEIPLTQCKVALVDDKYFEFLNQFKWRFSNGYAARSDIRTKRGRKTILMHRAIMDAPKGVEVDHVNGDKLDNQRSNLRLCNRKWNQEAHRKVRYARFESVTPHNLTAAPVLAEPAELTANDRITGQAHRKENGEARESTKKQTAQLPSQKLKGTLAAAVKI